jgi:hypothetical protein
MDWSILNLEYRIFSMDRDAAREILLSAQDLVTPWKKLQVVLGAKRARCEHVILLQTKPGASGVVEEVEEVPFAVGYEAAARPEIQETGQRTATTEAGKEDPESKKTTTTSTETTTVRRPLAGGEPKPGYPSAVETRNIGMTVEAEPIVNPDEVSIEINHVIQGMAYLGDLKPAGVASHYPPQPVFEMRKITSSQMLLVGQQMLVGTFSPPAPIAGTGDPAEAGRAWLIFVRATPNEP